MNLNHATLEAIFYTFDTRFQAGFTGLVRQTEPITTEIPSGTRSTRYPILDKIPRMRKWIGPRAIQNVATRGYELVNEDYELTVEVDRNDIEDDQLGLYNPLVDLMAQQAALWPDDLVIQALKVGTQNTCYDGQYFFDTDHPIDIDGLAVAGNQYANCAFSTALTDANLQAKAIVMQQIKGRDGRSLRLYPTHVIVGPDLEPTLDRILTMDLVATAAPASGGSANVVQRNPLQNKYKKILIHDWPVGEWCIADLSKPIRPMIFQRRKSPAFVSFVNPTDSNVFETKKFKYGCDSRGAAGYSLPQLIARYTSHANTWVTD